MMTMLDRAGRRLSAAILCMLVAFSCVAQPIAAQSLATPNPNRTGLPGAAAFSGEEWMDFRQNGQRVSLPVAMAIGQAISASTSLASQVAAVGQVRPRLVGANGRTSQQLLATNATLTTFESRAFFYVGVDTPYLQISFDNWAIDTTGADLAAPTALAIEGAALESDAQVSVRPLRFGGVRAGSISAGGTTFSDPIYATDFGIPYFKRGTKYWVRLRGNVPASTGRIPGAGRFSVQLASRFDPTQGANATSQVDATGAMTNKTGQDSYGIPMTFTAVVGLPLDSRIPSMIAVGDSIGDATNDGATGYAAPSGPAFLNRASFAADMTRPIPILNMARGSSSVTYAASNAAAQARRGIYYAFATFAVDEYGANDVQSTGNGDVPTIQAAFATQWAAMKAGGIGIILRPKLIPRNGSSDNWATLAGQTNVVAFDTKAQTLDDWFDTKVADGTLSATLGMNVARAAATGGATPGSDYWHWPVNGTANYATPDGTHPYGPIHILMAGELRAKIEALYPQVAVQ